MNTFKVAFYSWSIIICAILIVYALNVFPVPGTDSIVFIPPALLFSKGYGLANPLYYITQFTDPTHTNRFNYYVPFYSLLLGILSKIKPGVKTIFLFCSFFSIANLLLYARVITSLLSEKINIGLQILILLSVTYVAIYLLPTVGRPENLTALLVFLVYILYHKRENYSQIVYNLFLCVLFSLILATQLTCFYFCFLFFLTYELFNTKNIYRTIAVNGIRFISALTGFCFILALSPNGLVNTITGITAHISYVFTRSDRSIPLFIHYWFIAPLNFGFVFVFVLACICYVKELFGRLRNIPVIKIIVLIIVQLFILAGFIQFILYAAPAVYNATGFIVPLSAYLVSKMLATAKMKMSVYFTSIAFLTYLAGSLVFIRGVILFIQYKNDGKDYDRARPLVNNIAKIYPGLYTTNSLWPLFDSLDNVKIYTGHNVKKGDVIIVQQVNHPFPPELAGKCTIIYDWNTSDENKFLGIKLAEHPQGFGFVVCKVN
jgi:hypothetical protein